MTRPKAAGVKAGALLLGALLWWPMVHRCYAPAERAAARASGQRLLSRTLAAWASPRAAADVPTSSLNPEWDLMQRTFSVLALAELALAAPDARQPALTAMDHLIENTLAREAAGGHEAFLLPYAGRAPFVQQPARSLFVDGELALMAGVRRLVAEHPGWAALQRQRVSEVVARMRTGPVLSAESYPDECWTFCNTVALAAVALADRLDGSDHSDLLTGWVRTAKAALIDPGTGLLVSSYTLAGKALDGPEGSSIFLAAHMLQLVDPAFAEQQYRAAVAQLGGDLLGFGYAREWPAGWRGPRDVDSGAVVPGLEASPSASGFALMAASAFDDWETFAGLAASLGLAGFPVSDDQGLRYPPANPVGEAVIAYGLLQGRLWARARDGREP